MFWLLFWLVPLYALTLDKKLWQLVQQQQIMRLFGAAGICLLLLWQVKAQLPGGPALHFIGVTTATLVLGLRLSLWLIPAILLINVLATALVAPAQQLTIPQLLLDWSVFSVLALQSYLQLWWIHRQFGQHIFVYIFLAAFAGAACCTVTFILLQTIALSFLTTQAAELYTYLTLAPLLALPEAILNGMAITLLLVYRPQWVATYHNAP
jgi:uncharacterized membrane protein